VVHFFRSFSLIKSDYSPQIIENPTTKPLSLATIAMDGGSAGFAGVTNRSASILGQTPAATEFMRDSRFPGDHSEKVSTTPPARSQETG